VKGPELHRECGVRLYVCRGETSEKELKAAHATRLQLYQGMELNVTAELAHAAENDDHQLYVVSKIIGDNEQEMFHELLVS
jgi:hypothetical protein